MLDFGQMYDVAISIGKHIYFSHTIPVKKEYVESEENLWLVKGRTLSGKTYFRHLCWKCWAKEIENAIVNNDKLKLISKSRFLKWDRWYRTGKLSSHLKIPKYWNSPVWWFRLVFDMTEEELNAERSKFDTASLASFIRRYGEDLGKVKYADYCRLQAKAGCSLDYFIEKYGEEAGRLKYEAVCKDKGVSRENCIKKYGSVVGNNFFKQYCKTQAFAGTSIEFFIKKYGKEVGIKKYKEVCSQKAITLANFQRKYGKENGIEKYKTYLARTKCSYSKVSQELFKHLDAILGSAASNSHFFTKNNETEIEISVDGRKKTAKFDYSINNKVIEFNGDYWHANPLIYDENDIVIEDIRAKSIWERDEKRLQAITANGFQVYVVWENDYYKDPDKIITQCVKFLTT